MATVEYPWSPSEGRLDLRILVDRTSLEIFANKGLIYMPISFPPKEHSPALELFAQGGPARIESLQVRELKAIW